jgi:hypothetical protein
MTAFDRRAAMKVKDRSKGLLTVMGVCYAEAPLKQHLNLRKAVAEVFRQPLAGEIHLC